MVSSETFSHLGINMLHHVPTQPAGGKLEKKNRKKRNDKIKRTSVFDLLFCCSLNIPSGLVYSIVIIFMQSFTS